jgi:tetratricopeptide (TPR) repeat protein
VQNASAVFETSGPRSEADLLYSVDEMQRSTLAKAARFVCLVALLGAVGLPPAAAFADESRAQALALFDEGKKAYQEGRFEDAATLLDRAYALHPEPVLLYNLARAREGMGQLDAAIVAYEKYLREAGNIPDRGAIEGKVGMLKRDVAEKKRLAAERDAAMRLPDPPKPPPPPPEESSAPLAWPWVIAGVGAAGLAVGGALGGVALAKSADAEATPAQADAFAMRADAEDLALGSTIALIAGGAVLAGGFIWGIVDLTSSPEKPAAALWVGPARVGFSAAF